MRVEGTGDELIVGIECIVGGGDDYEIALSLFESFLKTSILVSDPSNNETNRTIQVELNYYGNPIAVNFTRPKLLNLDLTLLISFRQNSIPASSIKDILQDDLRDYINKKIVGSQLGEIELNALLTPILCNNNIEIGNIKSMAYKAKINGAENEFIDGYLQGIENDAYLVLTSWDVKVNTNA